MAKFLQFLISAINKAALFEISSIFTQIDLSKQPYLKLWLKLPIGYTVVILVMILSSLIWKYTVWKLNFKNEHLLVMTNKFSSYW